jgi:putative nucleotidyltransferase with HDIG domain
MVNKALSDSQLRKLKAFGRKIAGLGGKLAVYDTAGTLLFCCDHRSDASDETLQEGASTHYAARRYASCAQACLNEAVNVSTFENGLAAAALMSGHEIIGAALIEPPTDPAAANLAHLFAEMLALFTQTFHAETLVDLQMEKMSDELSQVYEELVLLHKLSTNMKVTVSDSNYLQMACDNLTDIVSVEGIAVMLEKAVRNDKRLTLAAGSGLIDMDDAATAILYDRMLAELARGKEALIDSEVDGPFRHEWPANVKSILAVPLCASDAPAGAASQPNYLGLMIAINRLDRPDFDSTDIKLFNSVANGCAVFIENRRLFGDLQELFIGSLKALTSSIDAKDPYTRGHSERVAFIARWIAERLAEQDIIDEEYIRKTYLAGLLHDIGKMGINEAVLCKKGKLTDAEFDHIRSHPAIGAGILSQIKQMRDIVPGVVSHHERADGKGYPNGIAGADMPLMGKIIALADSFDAMTSKRVYRDAMTVEEALAEIERGLGTQFDPQVGRIFIDSDVYRLWDIIQDGFIDTYGTDNLSQYGAVAVGTLLR